MLGMVSPAIWDGFGRLAGQRSPDFGGKVQRGWRMSARTRSLDDLAGAFLDEWSFERSPVSRSGQRGKMKLPFDPTVPDSTRLMVHDVETYLPDDILVKVDRASMAVSLETRAPFLDHRLAATAARIPAAMNMSGRRGKTILRDLARESLPAKVVGLPKAGFAVPIGDWLRGPLRPWAEEYLSERSLMTSGLFDPAPVRARWKRILAGQNAPAASIWAVLMALAWQAN
jgi:asparagine synthase (glutamine-hydrolysing)